MSKYVAFSLMVVTMIIGIIGGYAVSKTQPVESTAMNTTTSKIAELPTLADNTFVYTDQAYVSEMIRHHEDAVEMSKRVLAHTSRKEVRELAANIIEAQTVEITQMKQWLADWQ